MNSTIDLSICENEPIHLLGRIQPHGVLLSVDIKTGLILRASSNLAEYFNMDSGEVLGTPAQDVINQIIPSSPFLKTFLGSCPLEPQAILDDFIITANGSDGSSYHVIINSVGNEMLLEIEPANAEDSRPAESILNQLLSNVLEAKNLTETLQKAAQLTKDFIGFDRVMIYQFHPDDHGEVVAEAKEEHLEAFLGLHYPASDIPKQARALYLRNLVRGIKDVFAEDAFILNHETVRGTIPDLTDSVLRSVSQVHIEYLKNMGVNASFSVSLVSNNKLWGLIACHNYSPKIPDYRQRIQCKLLGQLLCSSFYFREKREQESQRLVDNSLIDDLLRRVRTLDDIKEALIEDEKINLLVLGDVNGACLVYEGNITSIGKTPAKEQTQILVDFLQQTNLNIFNTDQLQSVLPEAAEYAHIASGLLSIKLSLDSPDYILWYKQGETQYIKWAGNPEKQVEQIDEVNQRVSPRKSFKAFLQQIEGKSRPWSEAEIAGGLKMREEIILTLSERATHIKKLNDALRQAYSELETFSYTVSHDLRNPLNNIRNYAELLTEELDDEELKTYAQKIISNSDRMNMLISEVLRYSKVSKQDLEFRNIDMEHLLGQIVEELTDASKEQTVELTYSGENNIHGDPVMIYQVFSNLLSNAIKYSSKSEKPEVLITTRADDEHVTYTISDNGIGIEKEAGDKVFQLFHRSNYSSGYDGSGVGLAIVKRIIEKHKGLIWYESEIGKGTRFHVRFKK